VANSYPGTGHEGAAATNEEFIPDRALSDLHIRLSTHPLLDPSVTGGDPAGERGDQTATWWLSVAENLMLEAERTRAERRAALDAADAERAQRVVAEREREIERAHRVAREGELDAERKRRAAVEGKLDSKLERRAAVEAELASEQARRIAVERELTVVTGSRSFRYTAWARALARGLR
jgi:hypothetical protein